MLKIGIINYNAGNLASVLNAFRYIGADASLVEDADSLNDYDKLVLPGVGAFGKAMQSLGEHRIQAIKEYVKSGKYLLGICLGMQMLFDKSSEFGNHDGLGLIQGEVTIFDKQRLGELKIPQIGWNKCFKKQENKLLDSIQDGFYLYFVHSYHVSCDAKYILATCNYGYDFPALVSKDNILGIQPHPEKSHDIGIQILRNFVNLG